jgi:hypothetical protein
MPQEAVVVDTQCNVIQHTVIPTEVLVRVVALVLQITEVVVVPMVVRLLLIQDLVVVVATVITGLHFTILIMEDPVDPV